MSKSEKHKWSFPARFRTGAHNWKTSRPACLRLRETVSEIKKVARKDPVRGSEGAVRLVEKLWPALELVDSSSGALGSAVNQALDASMPVIVKHLPKRRLATIGLSGPGRPWQMDSISFGRCRDLGNSFIQPYQRAIAR